MKCLVPARAFRKRLAAVAAATPRRGPKPILQSVRLEVEERGRGTLVATDLETWIRLKAPVSRSMRAGAAQLPVRALLAILDEAGAGDVGLDADPDAFGLACRDAELPRRLVVTGPRSCSTLPAHRAEDYPSREEPEPDGHHVVARSHLVRLIRTTCFAVDPACDRYQLGGCSFGFAEGTVDVVATDGRRLAHASRSGVRVVGAPRAPADRLPANRSQPLAPVLGAGALRVLLRAIEELGGPFEPAELAWTADGWLSIRSGELQFSSRQLVGRFPAWREAFPAPSPHRGHLARSDRLLSILKRAKSLAGRGSAAVRVGLRPGGLTLALEAVGHDWRFETDCDCRSGPAEAVLELRHLIDVLDAVRGEAVDLELNGPGVPCVVHAAGLRYCMMPMGGEGTAPIAGNRPDVDPFAGRAEPGDGQDDECEPELADAAV